MFQWISFLTVCRKSKKANITSIWKTIVTVNWQFLFFNQSVHKQVSIFNNTLMNNFSNYIPNKFVTIDDNDPRLITERIKIKFSKKTAFINHRSLMARLLLITKTYMILEVKFHRWYVKEKKSTRINSPIAHTNCHKHLGITFTKN